MRRSIARLAGVCALALATAAFAGAAVAGNGNENAPGQQKQEPAAQPVQAQPQQSAPGQVKKESTPAPAKKSAGTTSSTHGVNSTQAGKKPSNLTTGTKPTHCTSGGGTGANATCTGVQGTPNDKPDVSKRYGNGKTAVQIANGRGAPAGTMLTGPGNSQPHKVAVCPKDANKSGGVDVHAVKDYNPANCAQVQAQQNVTEQRVCGAVITTTHTQQVIGVAHGKHQHLMTNQKSAHFTKHGDKQVVAEQNVTQVTPTGETCAPAQASVVQVQALPATQGLPAGAQVLPTVQSLPATQGMPAAAQGQGGVLGAQASLAQPKSKSKGGVLGTVGNVAGASLPFTGFPVWAAVLIAVALIATGLMLRRRGRPYSPRL